MRKSFLRRFLVFVLVLFVIAQFFRPVKNQGDPDSVQAFMADTKPPEEVALILKQSCFDCHSEVTRYPWYAYVTPLNYWIEDHIRHGKGDFNASRWEDYSLQRRDEKLKELGEEVEGRHMPLPSYALIHREAKLTEAQIESVLNWVKRTRMKYVFIDQPE